MTRVFLDKETRFHVLGIMLQPFDFGHEYGLVIGLWFYRINIRLWGVK